jgi:hypothetical protein
MCVLINNRKMAFHIYIICSCTCLEWTIKQLYAFAFELIQ